MDETSQLIFMWPAESKSEEKPQKRVDNGRRGLWWYSVKVVTYVVPLTRRAASPREKSKRVNAPQAPSALVLLDHHLLLR